MPVLIDRKRATERSTYSTPLFDICMCFVTQTALTFLSGPFLMRLYVYRGLSLVRFGGDLLSHVLRRSTIGVSALNGRVREGIGCLADAMTTKPKQRQVLSLVMTAINISWDCVPLFQIFSPSVTACVTVVLCFLIVFPGQWSRFWRHPCFYWIKSSLSSN